MVENPAEEAAINEWSIYRRNAPRLNRKRWCDALGRQTKFRVRHWNDVGGIMGERIAVGYALHVGQNGVQVLQPPPQENIKKAEREGENDGGCTRATTASFGKERLRPGRAHLKRENYFRGPFKESPASVEPPLAHERSAPGTAAAAAVAAVAAACDSFSPPWLGTRHKSFTRGMWMDQCRGKLFHLTQKS